MINNSDLTAYQFLTHSVYFCPHWPSHPSLGMGRVFPNLDTMFAFTVHPFCTAAAAAAAKSLQSCPTLCDPIDGSPPGSPVPGILQAKTQESVAISFSNAGKWKVRVKSLRRVRPSATPRTAAHQAPPSMGFSRQEYWSGVPLPSPFFKTKTLQISFWKYMVLKTSYINTYTWKLEK